jgi:hypothetical protein
MQGVYNTFIQKFGFMKMKLPSLDLEAHRTKLQLLVMQTEAFVRDPVNVVVKEKHFVVKNFYNTLVKEARRNFSDAKAQAERWVKAVVLPLEVQIKDHKAQLQSRLDNLAKINEKTTTINEQMAILKAAEQDLAKQREMIESLVARVSEYATRAPHSPESPAPIARPEQNVPVELMQSTRMAAFDPSKLTPEVAGARAATAPAPARAAAPSPAPAQSLISDDLMSQLGQTKPAPAAPAFDPMATQKLPAGSDRTQRLDAAERTQRIETVPPPAAPTPEKRVADSEKTQKIPRFDPNYRPDTTQKISPESTQRIGAESTQKIAPEITQPPGPEDTQILGAQTTQKIDPVAAAPGANAEHTQRLDDSIWRLQEAKRILQGMNQK